MIRMVMTTLAIGGGLLSVSTSVQAADVTAAEARAIAKEAYIYGFPMVDSYRIQYAYFVDTQEPRVQGALEPDRQHPARLHAGRQGDPNAQLRHALLHARHGPARRADGAHGAADREGALLQRPAHRRSTRSTSTTSAAARPATMAAASSSPGRAGKARRPRA